MTIEEIRRNHELPPIEIHNFDEFTPSDDPNAKSLIIDILRGDLFRTSAVTQVKGVEALGPPGETTRDYIYEITGNWKPERVFDALQAAASKPEHVNPNLLKVLKKRVGKSRMLP